MSSKETERQGVRTQGHAKNGDYLSPEDQEELDAEAARLKVRGKSYRQIAEIQGCSVSTAHDRVARCRNAVRREAGNELIQESLDRIEYLFDQTVRVLESFHYVVNEGRVVQRRVVNPDTGRREYQPLEDHGPVLAAVKVMNELDKSRRQLLGLDAPKAMELSGGVTYRFENVSGDDL